MTYEVLSTQSPEGESYEVWGIEMLLGNNEGLVSCTSDQCLIGSSGRSHWFFVMIVNLDRGSRNSPTFKSRVQFSRHLSASAKLVQRQMYLTTPHSAGANSLEQRPIQQ